MEEIEDFEFYHQDFTTASEWEVFIARLEEIINQWKVSQLINFKVTESNMNQWIISEENVDFADTSFTFFNYKKAHLLDDTQKGRLIPTNFYFATHDPTDSHEHCVISEWFGIQHYYVLSPVRNGEVNTESRIKLLLSSVQIALATTACPIPIFAQVQQKKRKLYLGVYQNGSVRTNFECVHIPQDSTVCQTLPQVINMFTAKVTQNLARRPEPVEGCVQNTYVLNEFGSFALQYNLFDSDGELIDLKTLLRLPFGITADPIASLKFKTTWNPSKKINSYLNPLKADKWSLLATFTTRPITFLSECFNEFLCIYGNHSTVRIVLSDFLTNLESDHDNPLNLLTESKIPTISNVIRRATRHSLGKIRRGSSVPVNEDVLVTILYWLFPDADENSNCSYDNAEVSNDDSPFSFEKLSKGFKTCKTNSLTCRLAIVMSQALISLGGIRAFSYLWFEFVQEMRYRWEKNIPIIGLTPGFPDIRTCLLHQKLQMLNCCIEHRKAREARETQNASDTALDSSMKSTSDGSSSSEDEFFDTIDDPEESGRHRRSLWNRPQGRLGKFENLRLIKTGDPLYIPQTQEPVSKTEDQLEEDTDLLLRLGSDAQGSELRAEMMSTYLLSDMESFKAANPDSILEDFIRWYSPRDWIEEDEYDQWGQKKGHLSSRMLISDNTWVQMWQLAKPVAANRQKRLFDDTREAEKVLHFLENMSLSQIAEMLLPIFSHAAIYKLAGDFFEAGNAIAEADGRILQRAARLVEKVSRDARVSVKHYELLSNEVTSCEFLIAQMRSLTLKLNPDDEKIEGFDSVVGKLARGYEVGVDKDSFLGKRVFAMFGEIRAKKDDQQLKSEEDDKKGDGSDETTIVEETSGFPMPQSRNFVVKMLMRSPFAYSDSCPQFMRVIRENGEVRLMSATAGDTVFF